MEDLAHLGLFVDSRGVVRARDELGRFVKMGEQAERGAKRVESATERMNRQAMIGQAIWAKLRTAMGWLGAGFGIAALVRMTDTWTDLNSRVRIAVGSLEQGEATMARLSEMARRTYSSLEQTAESFLLNSTALRELGYSTRTQLDFTETLNNALVVSGAKGERAASVMNALSRAMAGGSLRGQELNTVLQVGDRVASALAEGLGVSVNELRRMGAEGKLTSDVLMRAMISQMEKLREEADSMPATIGDAFVLLQNSLLRYVGETDRALGVSASLAAVLIAVADNMDVVAGVAAGALTAGILAMANAIGVATIATRIWTAALAMNPIGLVVVAISTLIGFLVAYRNNMVSIGTVSVNVGNVLSAIWATITESIKGAFGWLSQMALAAGRFMTLDFAGAREAFLDAGRASLESGRAIVEAWKKIFDPLDKMPSMGLGGSDRPVPPPIDPKKLREFERAIDSYEKKILGLRIELDTLGMSSGAVARVTAQQELLHAATEANIPITDALKARVNQLADAYGLLTDRLARAKLAQDLSFERDQLGRSELDQRVASRLLSAGLNVDLGSVEANMIRVNEQLALGKDLTMDFAATFRQEFERSRNVTEALIKALERVADKLLDMAMDTAVSSIWKAVTGSIGSINSGASAAYSQPNPWMQSNPWMPMHHTGYGPGDPIRPGERVAKLRTDESVLTPGQMRQLAPVSRTGASETRVKLELIDSQGAPVPARDGGAREEGGVSVQTIIVGTLLQDLERRGPFSQGLERRLGARRQV